jgi:hypothetical protein
LLTKSSAHVLEDLLPYVCIVSGCERSTEPFCTRTLWLKHLETKHELGLAKPSLTSCDLCAEFVTGDQKARIAHVENHLIEIALSILPTGKDEDTENLPPQIPISPSTVPNDKPGNDGGLIFITSGSPADFRSKRNMTTVRKKAMDAFLGKGQIESEAQSQTSPLLNVARASSSAHSTSHENAFEYDKDKPARAKDGDAMVDSGSGIRDNNHADIIDRNNLTAENLAKMDWKQVHGESKRGVFEHPDESQPGPSNKQVKQRDESADEHRKRNGNRLRRRVRGSDRRGPLIFQDPEYSNTSNILEVDEPIEGIVTGTHGCGPPSIPSGDASTLRVALLEGQRDDGLQNYA